MNGESVSSVHTDVGAYALGLLEAADRQAFEEHLAGCPACAAELAELSGMKSLLSDLGPVDGHRRSRPRPTSPDLVRRRAESQRRHTRRQVLLGAAAGVALLAGGVGVGWPCAGQRLLAGQPECRPDRQCRGRAQPGVHGRPTWWRSPLARRSRSNLAQMKGPAGVPVHRGIPDRGAVPDRHLVLAAARQVWRRRVTPSTCSSRAGPPSRPATCRGSTSSRRATARRSAFRSERLGARRSPDQSAATSGRAASACA